MKGAIFFSSSYGSTVQYARWIAEATGLPMFNVDETESSLLRKFDFLVLGSPIIYHKLMFHKWVKRNLANIMDKPTILFSVSGAGTGPKLDAWIAESLPAALISHADHVALRGRQNPRNLRWFDRVMLIIGGLINSDPVASKQELQGFDFMDNSSITPIIEWIEQTRCG